MSFDFLNKPPVPPADPVERRSIANLNLTTLRNGRPNPSLKPVPLWKVRWVQNRELDSAVIKEDILKETSPMDIVYTWVNGTDPALKELKERYKETSPLFLSFKNDRKQIPPLALNLRLGRDRDFAQARPVPVAGARAGTKGDQTIHRFRDNNELKYSLRSVAEYVPREMVRRIHILTTEVPVPDNLTPEQLVGQVPQWLDVEKMKVGDKVRLVRHREIYDNASVLPSFNSLSIESQMHHVPGLADTFIYLNDDLFFGRPIDTADFWTPLYGFVFHLTSAVVDPAIPTVGSSPNVGEWQSLQYTNYILSKQFGARHRAYISHIVHIMNVPILEEMQAIWPEEFAKTASHRFRGEGNAQEINLAYFMAHYVMERLRETQLASFWKYRLDKDQDGKLDWNEREDLIRMVREYEETLPKVVNRKPVTPPVQPGMEFRSFLQDHSKHLESVGIPWTKRTTYDQSGMDGYPFMLKAGALDRSSSDQQERRPYTTQTEASKRVCRFNIDFCLGPQFSNMSSEAIDSSTGKGSLFERLAFTEYHCGDCLLHIVRRSSPIPGMGSVMPLDQESEAYQEIAREVAKYNYVIGRSQFTFIQLTTGDKAERNLKMLLERNQTQTYFCVNDDVPDNELIAKRVRGLFSTFLETRFPNPSPWEH
ncbi:Xanthine phosphoribosyltransferase 1 [Mortierella sp. AD031]|nr:Xanthine phosphoribosyltransferase 1 [Mortierella sp. AD031]